MTNTDRSDCCPAHIHPGAFGITCSHTVLEISHVHSQQDQESSGGTQIIIFQTKLKSESPTTFAGIRSRRSGGFGETAVAGSDNVGQRGDPDDSRRLTGKWCDCHSMDPANSFANPADLYLVQAYSSNANWTQYVPKGSVQLIQFIGSGAADTFDSRTGLGWNGRATPQQVSAGGGNDRIITGSGNDVIVGSSGDDYLDGNSGNDTIDGGSGRDTIYGRSGNDYLNGDRDRDRIWGGSGDDVLRGGSGYDDLYGESGDDHLYGEADPDLLEERR